MYFCQTITFYELQLFIDWLNDLEAYPIEVYLNGVTYKFFNDTDKLYFIVGMEAYRIAVEEIADNGNMGI